MKHQTIESNVRSYCRVFARTFEHAYGTEVFDTTQCRYLDFLSGCGSLNYGHNHSELQRSLLEFINKQGLAMSLDMHTPAKLKFLEVFSSHILQPRGLQYRVQFPGPTGANAVEAAVKLARKVTGRTNVIAFTNSFHGCSLGALALTGSANHRRSSAALLTNVSRAPYDRYFGRGIDTAAHLERLLADPSSGYDEPAAIILETIQGEGGLNAASANWVQKIQRIARDHGALLIVDDIQAGCGRSGSFFSFEPLGIDPDIICLAKAISGYGLPMSLVLMKPDLDIWEPAEHNGTFRGNNFAFVTAAKSIEIFWQNDTFEMQIAEKTGFASDVFGDLCDRYGFELRGRGLMLGINLEDEKTATEVQKNCFDRKLIVETCGPKGEILKLLPPLTVSRQELEEAASIVDRAIQQQNSGSFGLLDREKTPDIIAN